MGAKIRPSEYEGKGPTRVGIFGLGRAWEKVRLIVRTGQVPEENADLDAKPDDWGTGGLRDTTDTIE